MEKLFTPDEAAEVLGTPLRFPRRLVAERRIRVKVGRYVRIPESAIEEFVEGGTVDAVVRPGRSWVS